MNKDKNVSERKKENYQIVINENKETKENDACAKSNVYKKMEAYVEASSP